MKDPSDRAASDDELTSEEAPHSQGKPRQAPPLPDPDVLELLESEEESMIHRLDFGLQTHSPPSRSRSDRAIGSSDKGSNDDADADLADLDEVDESGLEEQLELEDRFDWAFSRGQNFSAAPSRSPDNEPAPSPPLDLGPSPAAPAEEVNLESEPTTALRDPSVEREPSPAPASVPPSESATPVAQGPQGSQATQPKREHAAPAVVPVASGSAVIRPKAAVRKQRPARKAGVPGWLAGSAAGFLVLAGFSIWYLRSMDSTESVEEDDVTTLAGDLSSSDEPAPPSQAAPNTEPVATAPAQVGGNESAEQAGADSKIVLGSGGEAITELPIHGSKATPAPGAGAMTAPGPSSGDEATPAAGEALVAVNPAPADGARPQSAEKREWEPLILGVDLPGWQRRGKEGWSVNGNALTVRSDVKTKASTVLVTDRKFHDLALAFKVRPDSAGATFGVLARARSAGAVRLEFSGGFATLRAGEQSVVTPWVSKPGQWQPFVLIARGADILVYADRRKLAALSDPAPGADGRLGVYCKTGEVAFESLKVQSLD